MEIYLIRHTKPAVDKGICYGQTDLQLAESFADEWAIIRNCLPDRWQDIYSSPLTRCRLLAEAIADGRQVSYHNDLMELHCGEWEMRHWDEIPRAELDPWMENFTEVLVPGGESYRQLYARVVNRYEAIRRQVLENGGPTAIVAHGGVIRSILSYVTGTALVDSFRQFPLHYGSVAKLDLPTNGFSMLSNIEGSPEQHRPSTMKK